MNQIFQRRNQRGAVMAEGVVSLWLIITITVASISLLINSGMSMFYKQKIAYVAMQTATYTAQLKVGDDKVTKGQELAKKLLTAMGFSTANAEIIVKEEIIEDAPCVIVEITLANLPLFQGPEPGMMPFSVTLGDKAVAIKNQRPDAYVWLSNNAKMSGYLFPVVRMPPNGPQATGLPYVAP